MATYAAVQGVMAAIEGMLAERFPTKLKATPVNASVQLFGSQGVQAYQHQQHAGTPAAPETCLSYLPHRRGRFPALPGRRTIA